jgi:hypothetical protein
MAVLGISGGVQIIRHAISELEPSTAAILPVSAGQVSSAADRLRK